MRDAFVGRISPFIEFFTTADNGTNLFTFLSARLSHAQATFLRVLEGLLFSFDSDDALLSELVRSSKNPPNAARFLHLVLLPPPSEGSSYSPPPRLGRKLHPSEEQLLLVLPSRMGRVTTNSVGPQLRRKAPSKATSNSVSDRFDIFPFSDEKLVPKQPFSPIKNYFSPVLDILEPIKFHLGSIKFFYVQSRFRP